MNNLWYKKLGFHSNPFSIKPAAFDNEVIAYNMSFLYKKIDKGELLFLEGDYGSGKTTILKNIIENFKGENKIIHYSFNAGKKFDLDALLWGANSFVRKLTGLQVRNIILLLDEVHTMNKTDAKQIFEEYQRGIIKSVVFVTHDYSLVNFPEEMEELLDGNIIQTVNLSLRESVEFVRSRIGKLGILSDKVIKKLFKLADKNPRRLLEYCEDVSRYAVEIGDDKVTDFHIREILGDIIQEKKEEEKKEVPKKKPKKKVAKTKETKKEESPKEKPKKKSEVKKKKEKKVEENEEKKETGKKYKVNKLVMDSRENPYGQVKEKEDEEDGIPEYNVYLFN